MSRESVAAIIIAASSQRLSSESVSKQLSPSLVPSRTTPRPVQSVFGGFSEMRFISAILPSAYCVTSKKAWWKWMSEEKSSNLRRRKLFAWWVQSVWRSSSPSYWHDGRVPKKPCVFLELDFRNNPAQRYPPGTLQHGQIEYLGIFL